MYFMPSYFGDDTPAWTHFASLRRDTDRSYYDYDFYLSGGMTGHDNHNFHTFNQFTYEMRRQGLRVFNPAENFGGKKDKDLSTYMRKDHAKVTECGNIILLPSFRNSSGAQSELLTALSIPDMGIYNITFPVNHHQSNYIISKYR